MADRPGTNPLMVSEAGIDNGTEVDDVDTISSTSIQLAGSDKSIALVDESLVKEVAVTNAVPATAGCLLLQEVMPTAEKDQSVCSRRS